MATGKVVNQTPVYYGPSTTMYPSENSYAGPNDTVTVFWKEGSFYYIEYPAGSSRKRMYIAASAVTQLSSGVSPKSLSNTTRYVQEYNVTTYAGPANSGFAAAGSVNYGEQVAYLGVKENNYAFIEYSVSGGQKKRAWVYADYLAVSLPSGGLVVGQYPPGMNINGGNYLSSKNIYYTGGYVGECTWFCYGRALEKCNKALVFNGSNNGGEWYKNCNYTASGVSRSSTPVTNSICSCSGSTSSGHVIFVELVGGDSVYYTEANVGGTDGTVKVCPKASFPPNRTAYGYIVL